LHRSSVGSRPAQQAAVGMIAIANTEKIGWKRLHP
jgi:hypothetical protein